jgi:gas vesicle protein
MVISFIGGVLLGAIIGFVIAALLSVSSDGDEK